MKKYLLMCLFLPLLFAACSSSNEPGGGGNGGAEKVLGKSFKNYWTETYSNSLHEVTTFVDFEHSRVCRIHGSGHELYFDSGDDDTYSFNNYYEYIVNGNEIIVKNIETEEEEEQYHFTITGDMLKAGSDLYLPYGNAEIDNSLGSKLPPSGERTYIPVGWYDSGLLEYWVDYYAGQMVAMGDKQGLQYLPQDLHDSQTDASAIRIVNENTLQTAYPAITTKNRASYASHVYGGSVLFYFYYETYFGEYAYRVVDNLLYVRNYEGTWEVMGSYEPGSKKIICGSINNELSSVDGVFTKVNYSGGYDYE